MMTVRWVEAGHKCGYGELEWSDVLRPNSLFLSLVTIDFSRGYCPKEICTAVDKPVEK